MSDWWTVSGWGMTAAFGGLSLYQFVKDLLRKRVWDERERQLAAVKMGLVQLRAMLTEACEAEAVIKTDPARQFVRQIGHHVRSIEHHIDAMLGTDAVAVERAAVKAGAMEGRAGAKGEGDGRGEPG